MKFLGFLLILFLFILAGFQYNSYKIRNILGLVALVIVLYAISLQSGVKENMENGMKGPTTSATDFKPNPSTDNNGPIVTTHKSNKHGNLYYYIPPKSSKEMEEDRMENKEKHKSSGTSLLSVEELLRHNKISNITINFNRGNSSELNSKKREPSGNYYYNNRKEYNRKLKRDPYSCSL